MLPKFVKVFPHEFKRVMKKNAQHETVTGASRSPNPRAGGRRQAHHG